PLAVAGEDLGDRAVGDLLQGVVGVDELAVEPGGQPLADGGLARAHEAHQDDVGDGHCAQRLATKASTLRRSSSTLSPPNLRASSSASTRATMVSATTPRAG